VGGAQVLAGNNTFNIGKRNVMAVHKTLWKLGMGAKAEDVGGTKSRTVAIDIGKCDVLIKDAHGNKWSI
jgi:chemotaxis protein CheD